MENITDSDILEIFRGSQMHREIEKHFDNDSMPDFEDDFISMVRECMSKRKEGI